MVNVDFSVSKAVLLATFFTAVAVPCRVFGIGLQVGHSAEGGRERLGEGDKERRGPV